MSRAPAVLVALLASTALAAPTPAPLPPSKAAAPRPTPEPVPKARPRGPEADAAKPKLPAFVGLFGPASFVKQVGLRSSPGRWLEYETPKTAESPQAQRLRIAEVGPAPAGARWIEFSSRVEAEELVAMRMQFRGLDDGNLERLVVKLASMPVMEFPVDSYEVLNRMADQGGHDHGSQLPTGAAAVGRALPANTTARNVGTEKVVVPAGTFECEHWIFEAEGLRQDYWATRDPKVPFTGVVKMITETGTALLVATGADAKATIAVPGGHSR
jgi:hypothetical protein